MARPRKAPDDRRTDTLGVRLTAAERADLDQTAAGYGLTAAEFMRRRALGYRLPATQAAVRSQAVLATALMRIGVNLNQLARHANAGRPPSPSVIQELAARINAALDRLYDPEPDGQRPEL